VKGKGRLEAISGEGWVSSAKVVDWREIMNAIVSNKSQQCFPLSCN